MAFLKAVLNTLLAIYVNSNSVPTNWKYYRKILPKLKIMSPIEFITLYGTFWQGNTSICSFKYAILVQTSISTLFPLCQWRCPYLNYTVPKVDINMNMKMNMEHWWNNWQGKATVLKKNPITVPLFPQKFPYGLPRNWTQASTLISQEWTAIIVLSKTLWKDCWGLQMINNDNLCTQL